MNLVCYEYIACHYSKAVAASNQVLPVGTLVLSKFAGAANYLGGALVVNPWDKESCADALAHALQMNPDEARLRMKNLGAQLERQTRRVFLVPVTSVVPGMMLTFASFRWGSDFVDALTQSEKTEVVSKRSRYDSGVALEDLMIDCTL